MKYEITDESGNTLLKLHEQVTYSDFHDFDRLISGIVGNGRPIVVDVADVSYMDSAGLGMLINLGDSAAKSQVALKIRNPQGNVRELMDLASLDTIIPIEWR